MKLLLYYPEWENRWIPYIEKELSCYDLTVTNTNDRDELVELSKQNDVLFSMWANEAVWLWSFVFPEKKIISYLRRYELFHKKVFDKILWDSVDDLIFVNTELKQLFLKTAVFARHKTTKTHLIYNGLDLNDFQIDTSGRTGNKIAMVCSIQSSKNIYLACQILLALPREYKIYHIGKIASVPMFELYLNNLGLKDRFIIEGVKKSSEVPLWLADKDFILSTSISEGNPMNVLEGMAMGLKPVVHRWPGAEEQFEELYLFDTVRAAINSISQKWLEPELYRSMVADKFNVTNYKKLHPIIFREEHKQ